jgi:hypothetical protein
VGQYGKIVHWRNIILIVVCCCIILTLQCTNWRCPPGISIYTNTYLPDADFYQPTPYFMLDPRDSARPLTESTAEPYLYYYQIDGKSKELWSITPSFPSNCLPSLPVNPKRKLWSVYPASFQAHLDLPCIHSASRQRLLDQQR